MRPALTAIIIFVLLLSGCNSLGPAATAARTPGIEVNQAAPSQEGSSSVGGGSDFMIDEIGLGPNGYVALTNFTTGAANLGGLYLCQGSQCAALPVRVVEAGETVRIAVGDGKGLEGVVEDHASIGALKPSDGEVALFASDRYNDPKSLIGYLEWGSSPHELTAMAVEAGLWLEGSFAPTSENARRLFRQEDSGLWLFEGE